MISVIIPVVRPDKAQRCIEAIKKHSGGIVHEIVTENDTDKIGCPKMVKKLADQTFFDWVMFLGDDTIPQEGFMQNAVAHIDKLPDEWGMIGLNDQVWNGDVVATHWLCHKKMLELTGGEFFHTGYIHTECDRELTEIAQEHGRYIWAEDAKIEHENYQVGQADEKDEHLSYVYRDEALKHDQVLYLERVEERLGYRLGIGVPLTDDTVDTLFFYSFVRLDKPPFDWIIPRSRYHVGDLARCRNDLAKRALREGCTHLLMMDTDQVYHDQDMVHHMLGRKKDIVGAKVHRRWPPFEPILQRNGAHVPDEEIFAGGLVPVDATGSGCVLIRTKVFAHLDYPWYKVERDEHEQVTCGEDIYFCRKARKAGYDIYVDCDVNIGHLTQMEINSDFYRMMKNLALFNSTMKEKENGSESR
jgi:hypothetical protein